MLFTVVVELGLLKVERKRYVIVVWAVSEAAACVLQLPDSLEGCMTMIELIEVVHEQLIDFLNIRQVRLKSPTKL